MQRIWVIVSTCVWCSVQPGAAEPVVAEQAYASCQLIEHLLRPDRNSAVSIRSDDFPDENEHAIPGCEVNYDGSLQGSGSIAQWLEHHGWKLDSPGTTGLDGEQVILTKADTQCRILTNWPDSPDNTVHPPLRVLCSEIQPHAPPPKPDRIAKRIRSCPSGSYPEVSASGSLLCCSEVSGCD